MEYRANTKNFALLIDGSAMLTTKYFGNLSYEVKNAPDGEREKYFYTLLKAPNGAYINGVFPMFMEILELISRYNPKYIVVAFDKNRNTFRRKLSSSYKAQRAEKDIPLKEQFITMANILRRIGIPVCSNDTFEADDLIGSLANILKQEVPCFLLTKDHDYLQLIDDEKRVRCLLIQSSFEKMENLNETYGNRPELYPNAYMFDDRVCLGVEGVYSYQIPDKKGLSGDTADNISGVKGIGEKASVALLSHYKNIEEIYMDIDKYGEALIDKWKNEFCMKRAGIIYKALTAENARETAFLCKKLATIITSLGKNFKKTYAMPNIKTDEINKVMIEYGFVR